MKKLYLFLLSAFALFGLNTAKALTVDFEWNIPGGVVLYVGSTASTGLADISADATSYQAVIDDSFGSTWVRAAEGYVLKSAVADDGTNISVNTNLVPPQAIVNMKTFDGKKVTVTVEKIVYDAKLNVELVNGSDVINAVFAGTSRTVTFKPGKHEVPFSSAHESTIKNITFGNRNQTQNPECIHNQTPQEITMWIGNWTVKNLEIADGDSFKLTLDTTKDPEPTEIVEPTTNTVTLDFADAEAAKSVIMVRNLTQNRIISDYGSFDVNSGDQISLIFNTLDYVVTLKQNDVEQTVKSADETGKTGRFDSEPITENTTFSIAVTERQYGTTNVTLYISCPEGTMLREGSYDGPVINLSNYTPDSNVTEYGVYDFAHKKVFNAEFRAYTIPVSLKSPKIFVSAAHGYWVHASITGQSGSSDQEEANVATPESSPYVLVRKISPDKTIAVYVPINNTNPDGLEKFSLRDRQRNNIELQAGYNVLKIDEIYNSPFTVAPATNDSFSVYLDDVAKSADKDTGTYADLFAKENSVLAIFAGRPAASYKTISVSIPEGDNASTITYHKVCTHNVSEPTFKIFSGGEISVRPAPDCYLSVDGENVALTDGVYTFNASKNHEIAILRDDSGVENVIVDDSTSGNVYTIDGRLVLRDASPAQINALAPGLYIINGRKISRK